MQRFGVPKLGQDWLIKTNKMRDLVSSTGVLPEGTALGGRGDCFSLGLLEKSHQELTFTCDTAGSLQGCPTCGLWAPQKIVNLLKTL